jgi:hypothetical protein
MNNLQAVHVVTTGLEGLMKDERVSNYQTSFTPSVFHHLVVGEHGLIRSFKCSLHFLTEEAVSTHATPAVEGENSDA